MGAGPHAAMAVASDSDSAPVAPYEGCVEL